MMKKRFVIVTSILIVLAFLAMIFVPLAIDALGASTIDQKKSQLTDLDKKKKAIQSELNSIKNDKNQELVYKDKLQEDIDITQSEISTLNSLIADLESQVAAKQAEINELQAKLDAQLDKFKMRLRVMYEEGDSSYLDVLLSSESYYSFLTRLEVITSIVERDNAMIDEMKETYTQLAAAKAEIEQNLSDTESAKASVVEKQRELESKKAESQSIIDKLSQDEEYLKQQYAEAEKAAANAQAELKKLMAEAEAAAAAAAKKNSSSGKATTTVTQYVGGEFGWPCPGYSTITSEFGMRYHPVLRVNKVHTGIDISAPKGASVVAANAGTVITAKTNKAYGNYVVINHGGGKATLYAHMSGISVSTGQSVKKGQQVGLVGSTGYATGNHLHFEVIVNGTQVNPISYLK